MWQFLGAMLIVSMVLAALKLAIFVLVIAGLIFRTKETVALLLLGGVWTGFMAHPLIGTGIAAAILAVSLYLKHKEKQKVAETSLPALTGPDD